MLVSGDGDFARVVQAVKDLGKKVDRVGRALPVLCPSDGSYCLR
ncbi:MAG: NYN domain-containing protein [Bacillota bacterium]